MVPEGMIWGGVFPWSWTRIEGTRPGGLNRILLRRPHVGRTVAILWDVVLCSLWRREGHGSHGHHDWLVGRVDSCGGGLRAGSDGRCVCWDVGSGSLHLSPLEKLVVGWSRARSKRATLWLCIHWLRLGRIHERGGASILSRVVWRPSTGLPALRVAIWGS